MTTIETIETIETIGQRLMNLLFFPWEKGCLYCLYCRQ